MQWTDPYISDVLFFLAGGSLSRTNLPATFRQPSGNLPATSRIAPFGVEVEMPLLEEAQVITLGLKAAAALATNTAA